MTLAIAPTVKMHHATRAKAVRLDEMLQAEYPAVELALVTNEDASQVSYWIITHDDETILEGDKVPELADILEACEERGIDPEEGAEDEVSGSVVPEQYRATYKAASTNGQTCGDWLAEYLTAECHTADGFSAPDFARILETNAVDQSGAWARLPESGQKGWVGRWRMNGRQALEKTIALAGRFVDMAGDPVAMPDGILAGMQAKHAKAIAKAAKLEAALKAD